MKIRQGFVSNSSSSSFCILGYSTHLGSVLKSFKIKPDWENDDFYSDVESKISDHGFDIVVDSEDLCQENNAIATIGVSIVGFNIGEILELACHVTDKDKISILKKKLKLSSEPTVHAGEYNY